MQPQMSRLIIIVAITLCIAGAGILLTSFRSSTPNFAEFTSRDAAHYAKLAAACDMLLAATAPNPGRVREIAGNDEILPVVVRNLQPSKVEIAVGVKFQNDTNSGTSVVIRMGHGKLSYGIGWGPQSDTEDKPIWVLSAVQEHQQRILFTAKKPFDPDALLDSNK